MSAATQNGFGMPGMGGGAGGGLSFRQPDHGDDAGRRRRAQHTLTLQARLLRRRPAVVRPQAEHLPPDGLGAGYQSACPLLTPQVEPSSRGRHAAHAIPREYQEAQGPDVDLLGLWRSTRKPGQPVVIDFAQMQPPVRCRAGHGGRWSQGLGVHSMQPPSPSRNATYGEWPNERTRVQVPSEGSLVGDHVVRGNYSPEIKFTLTPPLDFLGALNLTTNAKTPAGSAQLGWGAVRGAQAYLASAVGGSSGQVTRS